MIRIDSPKNALLMPFFIVLVIVAIPFAALGGLLQTLQQRSIAKRMLKEWATEGKYILLCYYNGSLWRNYLENEIMPKHGKHIITMNWSEDSTQQVDEKYAELAHKAFDKYVVDYDYPSPEEDAEMRAEYQIALVALFSDGKVKDYSTYPMSPKEIIKYENKAKGSFEAITANCLASWKVK